jgi:sugar lactone lactonase YvrE
MWFSLLTVVIGISMMACSPPPHEVDASKNIQAVEDLALFPKARTLQRPEDGVILGDGTLVVGDQRHGLVAISNDGSVRSFGDFASAGYLNEPPAHHAGPNGVTLEPDGMHVLVADIFTGAIYRVDTSIEKTEKIYQHTFGVNTARRDSSGAIWFTQSTENNGAHSETRMFEAVDHPISDGAVFRIAPKAEDAQPLVAELKVSGIYFANGFVIDETNQMLYLSETMRDRVLGFKLDIDAGTITDQHVVVNVTTPDNMELHNSGELWVASPISSQIVAVDLESGETRPIFSPENEHREAIITEWQRRGENGEARLDLLGPNLIGSMPGLSTGMIIDESNSAFYVTGLGDALVHVQKN